VVGVCFHEAVAYGRWLTEQLPEPLRRRWEFALPSRVEWWAAARPAAAAGPGGTAGGPDDPLGPAYQEILILLDRYKADLSTRGNLPIGLFPPSAAGAYDLLGNVWQWCDEWFPGNGPFLPPSAGGLAGPVTVCGGPVAGPARAVAALTGSGLDRSSRVFNLGFRLVARTRLEARPH
jgi:formylglycine-generating enzyme required for sulfatase activity